MTLKILRYTPYARRLRLCSREVAVTLVLTIVAFAFIAAALNGGKLHQSAGAAALVGVEVPAH